MADQYALSIIAFYSHFDILLELLELLSGARLDLNVFTTNDLIEDMKKHQSENCRVFAATSGAEISCLKSNSDILDGSDHILILTIFKDYKFYSRLAARNNVSFICHNTHFTFEDTEYHNYRFKIRSIISSFARKDKLNVISSAKAIYFLSSVTLNYARIKYPRFRDKMKLLPYKFFVRHQIHDEGNFQITIPGGINSKYRNYASLVTWLRNLELTKPIKVVFLGKSQKSDIKQIQDQMDPIGKSSIDIVYYRKYLRQNQYDWSLQRSNVLHVPLNYFVEFRGFTEIYGQSKNSGVINDSIRFNIPTILPQYYIKDSCTPGIVTYTEFDSFSTIMNKYYYGLIPPIEQEDCYRKSVVSEQLKASLNLIS